MPPMTAETEAQQRIIERQVDRILAPLHRKPDTGAALLVQTFPRLSPPTQQAVVRRLAMHFATANNDHTRKLEEENKRLKEPPHQAAILEQVGLSPDGERLAVVSSREGILEVPITGDVAEKDLVPGFRVMLAKNGAVIAARGLPPVCPGSEFVRFLDDGRILARINGDPHLVLARAGEFLDETGQTTPKAGDLIEYEPLTRQAIRVTEDSVKAREFIGEPPDVTWDDIGGLDDIRQSVEEEVLGPIVSPGRYRPYRIRPPRGLLIEGPPGVGKTLLVKAIARDLLRAMKLADDAPVLFQVKATALQSSYVGEGPARVQALGAAARDAAAKHGFAVIMLDDFEYGGGLHRGVGDRSSPAYSTLSSALIAEMSGLDSREGNVLWAATANRGDLLDSALVRPGRFSKKIAVPRPGPDACVQILRVHLRERPAAKGHSIEELCDRAVERAFSCDDENILMRVHYADSSCDEIFPRHVISGALLAEAVWGAGIRAVRRDRLREEPEVGGITADDLCEALYEQLGMVLAQVTPANAQLHYLGLPQDRTVVAVARMQNDRGRQKESFLA